MRNEGRISRLKALLHGSRGSTLVIVALAFTALMGVTALVVDIGGSMVDQSRLQTACDAAALAAASSLPDQTAATQVANRYLSLNGVDPSTQAAITFPASDTIHVTGKDIYRYTFAQFLGYKSTVVSGSASAEAGMGSVPAAFGFSLFSGSTTDAMQLYTSSMTFSSLHSNANIKGSCTQITVAGACESVSGTAVWTSTQSPYTGTNQNASVIPMPDFSDTVKSQAETAGQVYASSMQFNQSIDVSGGVYVNGDVQFSCPSVTGNGCIMASGNIYISCNSLVLDTSTSSVCFYSQNGSIYISNSSNQLSGILYAPNGGINFYSSNVTIKGSVVAKTISMSLSTVNITTDPNELNSLPHTGTGPAKLID